MAVRGGFAIGDRVKLRILEKGSLRGQGVGHLSNGTMVVVDKAANKIGREITVELTNIHETSAGKMAFAKIVK